MRALAGSTLCAASLSIAAAGCVVPHFTFGEESNRVANAGDAASNGDASSISADATSDAPSGPGALQGAVSYPTGSGTPLEGILRVWLGEHPSGVECPPVPAWPPAFHTDIDPAPTPATYRFDAVPTGDYCLTIVLDVPPYFAPGELPRCDDPRSAVIAVTVVAPVTTAPAVSLAFPASCP